MKRQKDKEPKKTKKEFQIVQVCILVMFLGGHMFAYAQSLYYIVVHK